MKLKSIQVKNFRCVEDSTEFTVCPVTCLVGKNGAGKTSVLEALYKLNPDVEELGEFDILMEYPRSRRRKYQQRAKTQPDDSIVTQWELNDEDAAKVDEAFGSGVLESRTVTIRKGYYQGRHWSAQLNGKSPLINRSESDDDPNNELLESHLSGQIPKFLYFSKWHVLQGRVSLKGVLKRLENGQLTGADRIFLALLELGGTSAEALNGIMHSEELIADLEDAAKPITDEIARYWSQEKNIRVSFSLHQGQTRDPSPYHRGLVLETRILNTHTNVSLNFDERSTGFVWFFSFLVWYYQIRESYGDNLIILLDDPGIGLHAKAQEDLQRFISEKLEPRHQVLYVTHSPFMVNPKKLNWVRTVQETYEENGDNGQCFRGTIVGDRVLSTDYDTLLPMKASLGYRMLRSFSKDRHVLLVEKPEDVLYVRWFSTLLKRHGREGLDPKWNLIPCGDLVHLATLIGLLSGGAMDFAVLFTLPLEHHTDTPSFAPEDLLKTCHAFALNKYATPDESTIEDLLGPACYFKLVDLCYKLPFRDKLHRKAHKFTDQPVVQYTLDHFGSRDDIEPTFDGMMLAEYLLDQGKKKLRRHAQFPAVLDRFEALFKDVNAGC